MSRVRSAFAVMPSQCTRRLLTARFMVAIEAKRAKTFLSIYEVFKPRYAPIN